MNRGRYDTNEFVGFSRGFMAHNMLSNNNII